MELPLHSSGAHRTLDDDKTGRDCECHQRHNGTMRLKLGCRYHNPRPLTNPVNPLLWMAHQEGEETVRDLIAVEGIGITGAWVGNMRVSVASFRHARRVLNRLSDLRGGD